MKGNKSIIISFIVLIMIVFTGFSIENYLNKGTKKLLINLKEVESSIKLEDWSAAEAKMALIMNQWDNMSSKWSAFIKHDEIDNITINFKSANEYIKNKEKNDSMASLSSLKHFIYHIPLMEKVSLENIL